MKIGLAKQFLAAVFHLCSRSRLPSGFKKAGRLKTNLTRTMCQKLQIGFYRLKVTEIWKN
jgi:hypothetical protein